MKKKKKIVYTPTGHVVEVKNKGFRKTGISQVSQGTGENSIFHYSGSRTQTVRDIKREF